METLRIIMVTMGYISLIVFIEHLNEIAIVTNWLIIILFLLCSKKSFSLCDLLISFVGLSGLILSLHSSRAREVNSDEISLIRATGLIHLLMFLDTISNYLLPLYLTMQQVFKKQVYRKLFCIWSFEIVIISCFMWLFLCGISFVEAWINSYPFNTNNNFLTIQENLNASLNFRGESSYHNTLLSIQKNFFIDEHRSSLVYVNTFLYPNTYTRLIKAYPGEDANLTCFFKIQLPVQWQISSLSIHFMKDNSEIINSTRWTIHLPQTTLIAGSYHKFSATLFDIQLGDFGIYRTVLRSILRSGILISVSSTTMYSVVNVLEINSCVFNVSRIVDYYEFVDVPVGARLHFNNYYHRRVSESDHLRVEHFVNDIPLSMMSNISSECCLPSIHFYNEIWDKCPLRVPSIILDQTIVRHEYRSSEVKATLCACSSIFGIHRFKFYNEVYDSKQKILITSEFWHPQITVLYPKLWNYLSDGVDTIIDKSKKEKSFYMFEGTALKILQDIIENDLNLKRTIESVVIGGIFLVLLLSAVIFFIYFVTLLSRFRIYAYHVMGLRVRLNPPDPGGKLACLLPISDDSVLACENFHHDVFILYVDDDRNFVIDELVPIFKDKQISFFLSEEDLPLGRFQLEQLQLALSQCDKIIVIVSENFLINAFYNFIFLPHIVLFRLMKGIIHSGHLMFLVCKPCTVPEHLIHNEQVVIMDYTKNQKVIFFRKFNEWLERTYIPPCFGEMPILHPDLL